MEQAFLLGVLCVLCGKISAVQSIDIAKQATKGEGMRILPMVSLLIALVFVTASPVAAASPELSITAPVNKAIITGTDVTVTFDTKDFTIVPSTVPLAEYGKRPDLNKPNEGHLHITLDLNPLVVWDQNKPYSFSNVATGQHQLTVELTNNDHSSLTPPLVRTVSFNTAPAGTAEPAAMPATGADSTPIAWAVGIGMILLMSGLGLRTLKRK